jgi:hypothetical protein
MAAIRLADSPDANVSDLAASRRVRSADHLPLSGLSIETVADPKLHRQNLNRGRRCHRGLQLWGSHERVSVKRLNAEEGK